jgi:Ca2+/Na+ antiporter
MRALAKRKFLDEMLFAFAAFCIPLVLSGMQDSAAQSPWTAAGLFGMFLGYLYLDKKLNPNPPPSVQATSSRHKKGNEGKTRALGLVSFGVLGIILAGNYLGEEAKVVVEGMGVPQWAVGWILGFITSLPEMTAFFAVFGNAVDEMADGDDTDCQENLDSLAASNMSNLGLIYPIGIAVFLMFGS